MSPGALRLAEADNVGVAVLSLDPGAPLPGGAAASAPIPPGHKVALRPIRAGEPVIKYGQPIGVASHVIAPGDHVHTHNLAYQGRLEAAPVRRMTRAPSDGAASFQGYRRAHGRVGTRNFIGVITSVNCSATVARRIADHFTPERLGAFPHVDGVVAFTHGTGCGLAHGGVGLANLRRTIAGYARHPNFAGVLVVGLGCEVNRTDDLFADAGLEAPEHVRMLVIQDAGGTRAAIAAGIAAVEAMLPAADAARRERMPASALTVGLQCGGSDGYSGVTANPALGLAVDRLVAAGGTAILSETPEVFGAEQLLLSRAASPEVAAALVAKLDWWEEHAARGGADLNNNPSPGNLKGGLTTILEKSLGAVAKAGASPLVAVIDYAAPLSASGLVFMDSPGYDPVSATGQIASGANLIVFTTGRGSVFGSKPAPTLKVSSNPTLTAAMPDDIDVDAGRVLTGERSLAQIGDELFEAMLAAASGRRTASELEGLGDAEFIPWTPGPTL